MTNGRCFTCPTVGACSFLEWNIVELELHVYTTVLDKVWCSQIVRFNIFFNPCCWWVRRKVYFGFGMPSTWHCCSEILPVPEGLPYPTLTTTELLCFRPTGGVNKSADKLHMMDTPLIDVTNNIHFRVNLSAKSRSISTRCGEQLPNRKLLGTGLKCS